jgi:hypothetical protein
VVPAHWVVVAVRPAVVALLVDLDEDVDRRVDRLEVVELVLAIELVRHPLRGPVILVEDVVGTLLNVGISGVAVEPRAGEPAVPRPIVLGVRR